MTERNFAAFIGRRNFKGFSGIIFKKNNPDTSLTQFHEDIAATCEICVYNPANQISETGLPVCTTVRDNDAALIKLPQGVSLNEVSENAACNPNFSQNPGKK